MGLLSLFKKEVPVNESRDFMKQVLERDIRIHLPKLSNATQVRFTSSKEWRTAEPTKIMFREIYREDLKNETRPLNLFKEIRSDASFKDFSEEVYPVHAFFDIGKYGKKEFVDTIHAVIIPGYSQAKPAFKVYGFFERDNELHSCAKVFKSLGDAEFSKEFANFVQQIQWRREFPGTAKIAAPVIEDTKGVRNVPKMR